MDFLGGGGEGAEKMKNMGAKRREKNFGRKCGEVKVGNGRWGRIRGVYGGSEQWKGFVRSEILSVRSGGRGGG
jgi:hypothetical protein